MVVGSNPVAVRLRGGSRTAVTSKVELFAVIVNDFQPLTNISKSFTLNVAAVLDPPLRLLMSLIMITCTQR